MKENLDYCASSYLMYRTIIDKQYTFTSKMDRFISSLPVNRVAIRNSNELMRALKTKIDNRIKEGKKIALCLSGGIDSAILAKMLPANSMTYTFKCVVPGVQVVDETPQAKQFAQECNLRNKVIEIFWEDFVKYTPILQMHKGAPFHSIEVQIYKAALQAKKDGFDTLLFGESSDVLYGGMSMLLSKDWTFGEFVDRYSYVKPYYALKNPILDLSPYRDWTKNGIVDVHGFNSHVFYEEAVNSYENACATAGIECFMPFSETILADTLDLKKIRNGENKYLVREVFSKLYPNFTVPPKTPMPRPMNEWFKDWDGPKRKEFWPNCVQSMNGDQRWLVWCLEQFLNLIETLE